jgi:uncharacterized protein
MSPDVHTWYVILVIVLLGFTIGFAKGGFNALGAIFAPLLTLVIPNVAVALGVLLPMVMVGDAIAIWFYWRDWDMRLVLQLLPGAIVGALVGTALLVYVPANAMRWILALFTLSLVAYKVAGDTIQSLRYKPRAWHGPAVGGFTGLASALFSSGGPVFNSYLLLQACEPRVFIGTTALFFALLNLIKVPGYLISGFINLPLMVSFWWVFLFIPLGIWVARQVIVRIKPAAFEWVIMVLLVFSSGMLMWQNR